MTQEEKAKAYDEAYKVAENIHKYSSAPAEIKRMEEIFPELKGSEDERIRKELVNFFSDKDESDYEGLHPRTEIIAWLEKQGEQKPAKITDWNSHDSSMQLTLMRDIEQVSFISKEAKDERIKWLNSLDDRFVLEQKPTWSEEDELMLLSIIQSLKLTNGAAQTKIDWLKSLKERYTWKPSDMELEVLRLAAEKDGTCLMGLYEQLKKLKEE